MVLAAIIAATVACALVLFATPLVRRLAFDNGWVDAPDARKQHARTVPRLGGVALALGVAAGGGVLIVAGARPSTDLWALFGGAGVLWAVGLVDDLYGVGFKRKFGAQVLVAYGLLMTGWRLDLAPLPVLGDLDLYDQALLAVPISLVWIVGVVNAVNLTDGHDGLASGVGVLAFLALGVLALDQRQGELAAFCLVASAAYGAFLVYNWSPASVFMGDSGSLLLGFLLAGVSLRVADTAETPLALLAPVAVLSLPILDTVTCMVRRLLAGRSPFAPDVDHIHHRIVRAAASVRLGVLTLYLLSGAFAVLGILMGTATRGVRMGALLATLALCYLLLRQLSYVRVRMILRRVQRKWQHHHRAVQLGERAPLHQSLFVPPPIVRHEPGWNAPAPPEPERTRVEVETDEAQALAET